MDGFENHQIVQSQASNPKILKEIFGIFQLIMCRHVCSDVKPHGWFQIHQIIPSQPLDPIVLHKILNIYQQIMCRHMVFHSETTWISQIHQIIQSQLGSQNIIKKLGFCQAIICGYVVFCSEDTRMVPKWDLSIQPSDPKILHKIIHFFQSNVTTNITRQHASRQLSIKTYCLAQIN